jgi:hypothetical protein
MPIHGTLSRKLRKDISCQINEEFDTFLMYIYNSKYKYPEKAAILAESDSPCFISVGTHLLGKKRV